MVLSQGTGGTGLQRDLKEILGLTHTFYMLIWVVATQAYTFFKNPFVYTLKRSIFYCM